MDRGAVRPGTLADVSTRARYPTHAHRPVPGAAPPARVPGAGSRDPGPRANRAPAPLRAGRAGLLPRPALGALAPGGRGVPGGIGRGDRSDLDRVRRGDRGEPPAPRRGGPRFRPLDRPLARWRGGGPAGASRPAQPRAGRRALPARRRLGSVSLGPGGLGADPPHPNPGTGGAGPLLPGREPDRVRPRWWTSPGPNSG